MALIMGNEEYHNVAIRGVLTSGVGAEGDDSHYRALTMVLHTAT